ncbi:MAG: hypothetical protein GF330_12840 [Candidatus Eisenbacteria bacterium]|nr:hypothetical protein [Candidatus Eisenbacteria bacterium]
MRVIDGSGRAQGRTQATFLLVVVSASDSSRCTRESIAQAMRAGVTHEEVTDALLQAVAACEELCGERRTDTDVEPA